MFLWKMPEIVLWHSIAATQASKPPDKYAPERDTAINPRTWKRKQQDISTPEACAYRQPGAAVEKSVLSCSHSHSERFIKIQIGHQALQWRSSSLVMESHHTTPCFWIRVFLRCWSSTPYISRPQKKFFRRNLMNLWNLSGWRMPDEKPALSDFILKILELPKPISIAHT